MRGIIQDQLSHTFFEGPVHAIPVANQYQQQLAQNAGNPPLKPVDEYASSGNNDDLNIPYYKAKDPTD